MINIEREWNDDGSAREKNVRRRSVSSGLQGEAKTGHTQEASEQKMPHFTHANRENILPLPLTLPEITIGV